VSASFDDYVVARGPGLLRLAWLLGRDEHLAQDVVQEVLAKASTRWSRIERAGSPDAYVRKMVVNQLLSWRRRRHDVPTDRMTDRPAAGSYAGDPAGAHADRDQVLGLLASLPRQQRAVLVLRYYEGLDDDAIAAVVGCAPVTVRAHASKALARLRTTADPAKESCER
jgi:RNA polymerase sigma-70 factor (sigma-E family)